MFGYRKHGDECGHPMHRQREGWWAMRGGHGRGHGGPGGPGGRGGPGFRDDDGEGRIGRFLLQGDLRLLVLALVEKEPRHGYEIIRHIEELTYGFYAPSPGVVYPTLTYLEEAGYVSAEMDGNKKRYSITDEGRAHLDSNRGLAATIMDRLSVLAERIRHKQQKREDRHGHRGGPDLPRSVDAALLNLREVVARQLEGDERRASEMVKRLLQMADDLEQFR